MKQIFNKNDYHRHQFLKLAANKLRNQQTPQEIKLWNKIRCRQILNIHFYRQKILLNRFITDFYAPKLKLVIEIDGLQHFSLDHMIKDQQRDEVLHLNGITVKRYSNLTIDTKFTYVLEDLYYLVTQKIQCKKLCKK